MKSGINGIKHLVCVIIQLTNPGPDYYEKLTFGPVVKKTAISEVFLGKITGHLPTEYQKKFHRR
jgi:hypothetical protein